MSNPCGTTKANIIEQVEVKGIPIYFGTGVNPVNSPAQFFVAWGHQTLRGGLVKTFNYEDLNEGLLWFIDEDEAEKKFLIIQQNLKKLI